ncbi:MAG: YggS family pyridoxal phosphate-dependent enzyme [Bacteroidales bacterium]|nr:YggS family pyridoxal phosphate-dependent enzyme [Bacteroidales bacterium]
MMIKDNLTQVNSTIAEGVRLIAVSKTKPVEDLQEAYEAGQRLFGENKALEMRDKHQVLPKDIEWHFIGHLQTNKIKYIAEYVSLIHSIDSLNLLQAVNKEAIKHNRVIDCLLQFHVATEETKFGLDMAEAKALLDSPEYAQLHNVRIVGVMGMATNTPNRDLIRSEFRTLKSYAQELASTYFQGHPEFKEISMGMSGDYQIAMEEGSTLVRVGSAIFGARNYNIPVND